MGNGDHAAENSNSTGSRAIWIIVALIVVIVGAVVAWMLIGPGADDGEPVASPSGTESPEPSVAPSGDANAQPGLIDGFAPVPQFPAEAIPWDEVGAGWFVVDYREGDPLPFSFPDAEHGVAVEVPDVPGGLSLVSPEGDWYAALSHADAGAGMPMLWDGTYVWTQRTFAANAGGRFSPLVELVELSSGGAGGGAVDVLSPSAIATAPGGALQVTFGGASFDLSPVGPSAPAVDGCSLSTMPDSTIPSYVFSAAQGGLVACVTDAVLGSSQRIVVMATGNGGVVADVAVQGFDATSTFSPAGWIDDAHFVIHVAESSQPSGYYSVAIADGTAEFLVDGPADDAFRAGFLVAAAGVLVEPLAYGSDDVAFLVRDLDGATVATLDTGCEADVDVSGASMMWSCDPDGDVVLVDLATGAETGSWELGSPTQNVILGHPGF